MDEVQITILGQDPTLWQVIWQLWTTMDLPWKKSLPNGPRGLSANEALELIQDALEKPILVDVQHAERLRPADREWLQAHRGKVTFRLHEEPAIAWPGPWRRRTPRGAT